MRPTKWAVLPAVCGVLVLGGTALALAETKVEIKSVHLCCPGCVKGVGAALKKVEGATPKCDQGNSSITITAKDEETAQKALDALSDAGYFGDTGSKTLYLKAATGVPAGKVKSLSLSNAHNCCGACTKAIKAAVKGVDGVKGDTAKAKTADFDVTGDFEAAAVVKALNDAGFQVKVKE